MDILRRLIALKWKLALRGYQRDRRRLVGLVLLLLFALPVAIGFSVLSLMGYLQLPGRLPFELLSGVLTAVWLLWTVFPVLGFSLNETYDPTKLFVFPLTTTTIFFAGVLGAFLDLPVVFLLPMLLVILIGFGQTLASVLFTVAALALFMLQTLAFSQTCLTALLGLLKSRRFQDAVTIIVPLISVSTYVALQVLPPQVFRNVDWSNPEHVANIRFTAKLIWLPSGLTEAAIENACSSRYGLAFTFLALLAVVTVMTIIVGGWVLRKVHLGEIDVGKSHRRERRPGTHVLPGFIRTALNIVPVPVRAMLVKELRHLWREPEMKAILVTFLFPVIFLVVFLRFAPSGLAPYVPLIVGFSVFGTFHLAMNAFGHDRQALEVLLSYPTRRRDILLGKNIAASIIMSIITVLLLAIVILLRAMPVLGLTVVPFVAAGILVLLAAGNFSSIYFPTRIPHRGENPYTQSVTKGCITAFVRTIALQAAAVTSLPIVAGFVGPWLYGPPAWLVLTAPLSLIYGLVVYRASLRPAERSLLRYEHRILEVCAARED